LILAIKPTPQASCSLRGSYSPCLAGAFMVRVQRQSAVKFT
jgi:hypothetical protein